ncbi:hypothetical protein HMPREF9332_00584 [Alloprevotella rava F0323]|uniref:Bacterial repeat domain-containing protein n=1 Tax=Alloprevotella rava F0323 TaxID=679199 RepID=G5GAI3_9BACT|nr:Calx-beta domain-containing protein [Alloprevotella rava]EHG23770.1 hypothetical protein HMPREF9332_00584 [Alloprevotella rava F0323]
MNIRHFFSFVVLMLCSLVVQAQTNILQVPDMDYAAGKRLDIPVEMENTSNVVAVQFDIQLPYHSVADSLLPSRLKGHEMTVTKLSFYKYHSDFAYRVIIYSANNNELIGSSGALATFSVKLPENLENGKKLNVKLHNVILSDRDGKNVATGSKDGVITVKLVPRPDLVPTDVKVAQTQASPKDPLDFSWTVRNQGDSIAAAGWTEKIFLQNEDGIKVYVGMTSYEGVLAKGASVNRSLQLQLDEFPAINGNVRPIVQILPAADCGEITLDQGNNTAAADNYSLYVKKYLVLTPYQKPIPENSTSVYACELRRTGDISFSETFKVKVTDRNGNEGRLRLMDEGKVTFVRGTSRAYIGVQPVNDDIVSPDDVMLLIVNTELNNGYGMVRDTLHIEEDELASLTLTLDKQDYNEGDIIHGTLTAERPFSGLLTVNLAIENQERFSIPRRVIFAEGATTANFDIKVLDDKLPANDITVKLTATAKRYTPANVLFLLHDNDMPAISLTLTPKTVGENAGPQAIYGTVTRSEVTDNKITVKLSDDSQGDIYYSVRTLTLPPGTTTAHFPLGVVDNSNKEGDRMVHIRAAVYMTDCDCDAIGDKQGAVSDSILITDDDGPMLSVTTSKPTVLEGEESGTRLTVRRNTETSSPLTVELKSDGTDVELPFSVTIPAGQSSVTVTFKALANGVQEGDRTVSVTATANGFSAGSCWMLISDRTLPDAAFGTLSLSKTQVDAGSNVDATILLKNIGAAPLPAGVIIQLLQDGKEISSMPLPEALPVASERALTMHFRASDVPGDYRITAVVNSGKKVVELLYLNNKSEAADLKVLSLYTFTIAADKAVYNEGDTIRLTGQAMKSGAGDVNQLRVEPYIIFNGDRQALEVQTDASGHYETNYVLPTGYRGSFSYGVCIPGEKLTDEMGTFNVYGFERTSKDFLKHEVFKGEPYQGSIMLKNMTGLSLHNITPTITSNAGEYLLEITPIAELSGSNTVAFQYTLTGQKRTVGRSWERVELKLTSDEGATLPLTLYCYTREHHAKLVANIDNITTSVTKDQSRTYPVQLSNTGLAETGRIKIVLPEGLSSFISLVTPQDVPSLKKGESTTVMLRFTAGNKDINAIQKGSFAINCANGNGITVHFNVKVVSESKGNFHVRVRDENTIYGNKEGEHPYVENASVQIKDVNTGALIVEGKTDADGRVNFDNLNEGYYSLYVTADKHGNHQQNILVSPGETTELLATISYQAISVTWDVEETEVEDEYSIVPTLVYETQVPVPVVRMTLPDTVALDRIEKGRATLFNILLRNDGLIAAQNVRVNLPKVNGFTFQPLMEVFGITLGAGQSKTIPVRVTHATPSSGTRRQAPVENNIPCSTSIQVNYEWPCGENMKVAWVANIMMLSADQYKCTGKKKPGSTAGYVSNDNVDPADLIGINPEDLPSAGYSSGSESSVESMAKLLCTMLECIPFDIPYESCFATGQSIASGDSAMAYGILSGNWETLSCLAELVKKAMPYDEYLNCVKGIYNNSFIRQERKAPSGKPEMPEQLRAYTKKAYPYADYLKTSSLIYDEFSGTTSILNILTPQLATSLHRIDSVLMAQHAQGKLEQVDTLKIPLYAQPGQSETSLEAELTGLMPNGVANIQGFRLRHYVDRIKNNFRIADGLAATSDNYMHRAILDKYTAHLDSCQQAMVDLGFASWEELVKSANRDKQEFFDNQSANTCAKVKLEIDQKLVLTRQAFRGTLTIENSMETELKDIDLKVTATNLLGELATSHEMQINFEKITGFAGALEGPWTLGGKSKGVATILFIPTKYAAPDTVTTYSFGGTLNFTADGESRSRNLWPVKLQVKPSPELDLTYFMQRDIYGDNPLTKDVVEPVVPAEFSVLIHNKGRGEATNVRILKEQPKVVENAKGQNVNFAIVASSLNGQPQALALDSTIATDFGNIAPDSSSYATWYLTSSLLGHFTGYNVNASHVTSYGNPDLSLLDRVTIHELIHSVNASVGTQKRRGWVVNDEEDELSQPDRIYLSDGTNEPVEPVSDMSTLKSLGNSKFELKLTVPQKGWFYTAVPDPTQSLGQIVSVRNQTTGEDVDSQNFWQTRYTMQDGFDPVRDNRLHLVAYAGSPVSMTYVITFEPTPEKRLVVDSIRTVPADDQLAEKPIDQLTVYFNKPVDASSFTRADIELRYEGIKLNTEIPIAAKNDSTFTLNTSSLTKNGFYMLSVNTDSIRDREGFWGYEGQQVRWMLFKDGLVHYNISAWPSEAAGTVSSSENSSEGSMGYGDEITLTANPGEGHEFDYWGTESSGQNSGSGIRPMKGKTPTAARSEKDFTRISSENPLHYALRRDEKIVAVFKPKTYKLRVNCKAEEGTTSCGSGVYDYGSVVNIKATANEGYSLIGFVVEGDTVKADETQLTVDKDINVDVVFKNCTPQGVLMLEDAEYLPVSIELANVTLKRTFRKNSWNTICLPCPVQNPANVFGTGTVVARLTGVNNGYMRFSIVNNMEANVPYLIQVGSLNNSSVAEKSTRTSFYSIESTMVVAPTSQPQDVQQNVAFLGTYSPLVLPRNDGYYYISSDMVYYVDAAANVPMGRFRGYFHLTGNNPTRMGLVFGDTPTGIDECETAGKYDVYNLAGICVRKAGESLKGLSPGIYIIGGKKTILR